MDEQKPTGFSQWSTRKKVRFLFFESKIPPKRISHALDITTGQVYRVIAQIRAESDEAVR